jgi:hypothetical protein
MLSDGAVPDLTNAPSIMHKSQNSGTASIAMLVLLLASSQASAGLLYAHTNFSGQLYGIDTFAQTATLIGTDTGRAGPEIQIDPAGSTVYLSIGGFSGPDMTLIDPITGLTTGSMDLSLFPGGTDAITALEFVGSTLYGSFHEAGPESGDGILGTINTITGAITTIGPMTGMNRPTGGLQFLGGTMYAVSSTNNNDSRLFTVNLLSGAAPLVANLTLNAVQQQSVSALAYTDGKMFTVLSTSETNLYSIDLDTGAMTVEFDLGTSFNSLTADFIPEPSTHALILAVPVAICAVLRKRRVNLREHRRAAQQC